MNNKQMKLGQWYYVSGTSKVHSFNHGEKVRCIEIATHGGVFINEDGLQQYLYDYQIVNNKPQSQCS